MRAGVASLETSTDNPTAFRLPDYADCLAGFIWALPWQNVDRLQRQWLADFDQDPLDGLDTPTVRTLRLAFSRRHLLEHNGGVIDERYKHETGEGSIGRRVRIMPAFVDQALDAVVALAARLEAPAR